MKDIIYIGELDQDVDDVIAAEYLHLEGKLKGVVLDPYPETEIGLARLKRLKELGIQFYRSIPSCSAIFVGGAFTEIARFLRNHKVDIIVANGGFVGANIVPKSEQLPKFRGKEYVRTFNFNMDVDAITEVLNSKNVGQIYLIGKNVCHDIKNTREGIWKDKYTDLLEYHQVPDKKRLHDLLACHEGIQFINGTLENCILKYENITCVNKGLNGKYTEWGSKKGGNVISAVGWR